MKTEIDMIPESVKDVKAYLERRNIFYWLDSGSLLFLIRDNTFPLDDDFDISIWASDEEKSEFVEYIISHFENVKIVKVADQTFKLKIHEASGIIIDLNFFENNLGILCCPQRIRPNSWTRAPKALRRVVKVLSGANSRLSGHVTTELSSKKWSYSLSTWTVPIRFLGNRKQCQVTGLRIPEYTEEYLAYRYGNWKVPNKYWNFAEDDASLARVSPASISGIKNKKYIENPK